MREREEVDRRGEVKEMEGGGEIGVRGWGEGREDGGGMGMAWTDVVMCAGVRLWRVPISCK